MSKDFPRPRGEARPPRRPKDVSESRAETSLPPYLGIKSTSPKPRNAAETAALKELELLVRGLLDVTLLPPVWENRLHKQLSSIDRARIND